MTPEESADAKEQFLRGAPLLMSYINPARISGSSGERNAFGLLFNTELRKAEPLVNKNWLFTSIVTLTTSAEVRELVEARQSIFTAGQEKLSTELRTLFLIGWQNGRTSTAFTPEILNIFQLKGYLKRDRDPVEEEALEQLMREAIVVGANSRADHTNSPRTYMADMEDAMGDAIRRLSADDDATGTKE